MATPHKLTLVPYLQRWDHTSRTLTVRLLIAPAADPLAPLLPAPAGVPAFADAKLAFAASISDTVLALPQRDRVDQTAILPAAPDTRHAPHAREIFTAIGEALAIPAGPAGDTFAPQQRDVTRQLRKYLPGSYRRSFGFVRPRTSLAVTDASYHCLMKCPPDPAPPAAPNVIGWGEAIAYALRRPRLAEALGLVVTLDVPVDADPRLAAGGWLWVDLAAHSDYADQVAADPALLRAFATRVPPLPTDGTRPVFTPVAFPVSADATEAATLGNYDKVFAEALRFDDGFAKIVHARQPVSSDPLDEAGDGAPIARDEGIQLGWDDEDILEGQNRALGAPPDGEDPVLAPRGVLGYRVDVRPAGGPDWTSLSLVDAPLNIGVDLGVAREERWSEVAPAEHSGQLWLPAWFVRWRGGSLVVDTDDEQRLMEVPAGTPEEAVPVDADTVAPRYGQSYEFRVRLADPTGGGPELITDPVRTGEAPTALLHLRRHRPPARLQLDPFTPEPDGTLAALRAHRPRLGYPEAVYAAGPAARADLLAQIAANAAGPPEAAAVPSIADPDTALLQIRLLLKAPAFDPAADADGYVDWYTTTRLFPDDVSAALDLTLSWVDAADYRAVDVTDQLGPDGLVTGPVTVITGRDLRLELRAVGRDDLGYFGSDAARFGPAEIIDLHGLADPAAEADLLRPLPPADTLRSVFLRPDPTGTQLAVHAVAAQSAPTPALLGRLAGALDLVADGSTLLGAPGERVVFGCAGLGHYLAPDGGTVEFTDPAELAGQWLNAVALVVDRDWTWRGAGSPTVTLTRTLRLPDAPGGGSPTVAEVGVIELVDSVNVQATTGATDRGFTRMVFLDALAAPLGPDGLPYEVQVDYEVTLRLEGGDEVRQTISSTLPIVTPPRQVPRVVAAGIALTPYGTDPAYAATLPRIRRLWLEFAEPLVDPRDAYFVRPLTVTPDPMLLPGTEPVADPATVPALPLDPELIRTITPGQVQDLAGYATMQRLEPAADSDRHFLVPLPPNTDPGSPELFSFYTYEIRVGHDRGPAEDPLWSTAQGRFGEALTLEGVAHPAPELVCTVLAEPDGAIGVRAPYATPYVGLRRALPNPPNTQLWAVLYARVVQADAATRRNVQIDLRRLAIPRRGKDDRSVPLPVEGETYWTGAEVRSALAAAGLPDELPVSVLCVEVLPEPNGGFVDPLGGDLGQVRILRTSPLSAVERDCCVS
ncbi:hypothetical protein [Micromonospora sp. NBC_01813]|uniref:hypothetical protein n=1 Tax=Micromonospora sp. NBC_01813 TaxID=2975988 RepID=UPI002DD83094|nr:hypothetical protein [Micromonospora sp. NBC_01813]WSA08692.1 hypothetical protein OG958_31725 [Micromonospora sp. NBC_01813]